VGLQIPEGSHSLEATVLYIETLRLSQIEILCSEEERLRSLICATQEVLMFSSGRFPEMKISAILLASLNGVVIIWYGGRSE
jgi:hypothetical protein